MEIITLPIPESRFIGTNGRHEYYNSEEKQLSGITTIISKLLFPRKYANIPQHILDKAAKRGTLMHLDIQMYDRMGIKSDKAWVHNYIKIKKEHGLTSIANEYLVSDNKRVATQIDGVYNSDAGIVLGDIKSTARLDLEYISWQLSIGAYLFEKQTGLKVVDLKAIWLREDKYKCVSVARIDDKHIKYLLDCYFNEKEFINPISENSEIDKIVSIVLAKERVIKEYEDKAKEIKAEQAEYREKLMAIMSDNDISSKDTDTAKITYIRPSSSSRFDSTKFAKDHPELDKKYRVETKRKGSLRITLQDNEDV